MIEIIIKILKCSTILVAEQNGYPKSDFHIWVHEKLNKAFLYFYAKFCGIFDDFSKFRSTFDAIFFEKSSNIVKICKKMKKSLGQLASKKFLRGT